MKNLCASFIVLSFFLILLSGFSVEKKHESTTNDKTPKLVIGIVVDQMRYDYFYRYWDHYGDGGFKRMLSEGFSFDNAHFDYAPTFTGPGHASVYTGTTPAVHGIIGNSWFLKETGESTYVTEDSTASTVGSDSDEGEMSPRWMLSTSISDELRLHTNMQSKAVAIALKDRGSILPAGFTGEAYWFDTQEAVMISSTFYMNELPKWVHEFNEKNLPAEYLSKPWETLVPIENYRESIEDNNQYEGTFRGQNSPVFPHDLPSYTEVSGNGIIANTPFGNTYTFEMAYAAIEGENLGQREHTDLLAVSFSSTDYIGHRYGPASKEVQDTYVRLDRDLEHFLNYLDERFGKENVLVFLTSDHGGAHNPEYMRDLGLPTGNLSRNEIRSLLEKQLTDIYGFNPILRLGSTDVYLNYTAIRENGVQPVLVQKDVADILISVDGIAGAITANALRESSFHDPVYQRIQRGYNPSRSGDVLYWVEPQWFTSSRSTGTTHGTPWSYDSRAPLVWYGWNIPAGNSTRAVGVADIASTVANFINIPYTTGNTGQPMNYIIYSE